MGIWLVGGNRGRSYRSRQKCGSRLFGTLSLFRGSLSRLILEREKDKNKAFWIVQRGTHHLPTPSHRPYCTIPHLLPLLINQMCYFSHSHGSFVNVSLVGFVSLYHVSFLCVILYVLIYVFMCGRNMCVGMQVNACVCRSQRTISGINPQEPSILFLIVF